MVTLNYLVIDEFFVERLAYGIARIAATWWPNPVIVRMSDLKTNEYARLIGGTAFEPEEENPMLGWRGASRYYSEGYRQGFGLECRAIRRVRDDMGLTNTVVMIPFCRTLREADRVLEVMADHGLRRADNGLQVYVMAEIPANIVLAEEFAERFDGFSIGSNDLTQLVLGVDRDSGRLASLFDETDPAVTTSVENLINSAHRRIARSVYAVSGPATTRTSPVSSSTPGSTPSRSRRTATFRSKRTSPPPRRNTTGTLSRRANAATGLRAAGDRSWRGSRRAHRRLHGVGSGCARG